MNETIFLSHNHQINSSLSTQLSNFLLHNNLIFSKEEKPLGTHAFHLEQKISEKLKEQIKALLSSQCDCNIFTPKNFKLAVFDMDSTLLQVEVIDELAKIAGCGDKVAEVTEQAMRGELDFTESLRKRVSCLRGLNETAIAQVRSQLPLNKEVDQLFIDLKNRGVIVAILSGGFTYFAEKIQEDFNLDYIYANQLVIENGQLTGQLKEEIIDAEKKSYYLKKIAKKHQIDLAETIAVGDGANDLIMLNTANLGIAYHAKPIVREQANHQLTFSEIGKISDFFLSKNKNLTFF